MRGVWKRVKISSKSVIVTTAAGTLPGSEDSRVSSASGATIMGSRASAARAGASGMDAAGRADAALEPATERDVRRRGPAELFELYKRTRGSIGYIRGAPRRGAAEREGRETGTRRSDKSIANVGRTPMGTGADQRAADSLPASAGGPPTLNAILCKAGLSGWL